MADFYTLDDLRGWRASNPPVRLGLFGDPVAHSLSPRMQNAALAACGIEMGYAAFHILPNELTEALSLVRELGFVGLNFTTPHKVAAAQLVDALEPFAREVGAINTMRVQDGKLLGANTDGPGFAAAIREEFALELGDLRILLLGAGGGAGRAIAHQCAREKCQRLVLANRTFAKAETLAAQLQVEATEWSRLESAGEIDLVVNATPLPFPLRISAPCFYDINYAAPGTNGLSLLLHQGVLAFEKWFARPAPIEAMRATLSSVKESESGSARL